MTEADKPEQKDQYWWTPWAVLAALVLYGLLGFLGALTPKQNGPTAADVPVAAPSAAPSATLHTAKPSAK
jgi:hypothetical protein